MVVGAANLACRHPATHDASPAARPEEVALPSTPVSTASSDASEGSALPLPEVMTDWCLAPWRGLDEATCYLVPPANDRASSKRLLIYLSGIVPPEATSSQKENVQRVVASAARRAGMVALLPRGRRGIGPADAKDWWAWPTSPRDHATFATAIVAEWASARAKLEGSLGRFDHVYLAGSSSGAYFLSALVLEGAIEMDGYAAISGGSVSYAHEHDAPKRPFYVGYGANDSTNGGPKTLASFLERAGWPVRVAVHPGGHGAREVYVDEALAFWRAAAPDAQ
jgi:predicted esterase